MQRVALQQRVSRVAFESELLLVVSFAVAIVACVPTCRSRRQRVARCIARIARNGVGQAPVVVLHVWVARAWTTGTGALFDPHLERFVEVSSSAAANTSRGKQGTGRKDLEGTYCPHCSPQQERKYSAEMASFTDPLELMQFLAGVSQVLSLPITAMYLSLITEAGAIAQQLPHEPWS